MAWIELPDDDATPQLKRVTQTYRDQGRDVPAVVAVMKTSAKTLRGVMQMNQAVTFGGSSLGRRREPGRRPCWARPAGRRTCIGPPGAERAFAETAAPLPRQGSDPPGAAMKPTQQALMLASLVFAAVALPASEAHA